MKTNVITVMRILGVLMFAPAVLLPRWAESNSLKKRDILEVYERKDSTKMWGKLFNSLFRKPTFEKSYAIVIGLSDYTNDWDRIEAPYHDVIRITDHLINRAGFDYVVSLTNRKATKKTIEHYMEDIFPDMIKQNDRFFFYFSGHGTQRDMYDGPRGYLPMLQSEKDQWSRMISMDDIEDWHKNVRQARHVLFVLDSCFSGLAGYQSKANPQRLYLNDLSRRGHYLLTAGDAGQESFASLNEWGGSLFTYAFLEGIRGGADASTAEFYRDGVVSLTELQEYVRKKIKKIQAKYPEINQSPQRSDLNPKSDGEFFFITEQQKLAKHAGNRQVIIEHGWPVEIKAKSTTPLPFRTSPRPSKRAAASPSSPLPFNIFRVRSSVVRILTDRGKINGTGSIIKVEGGKGYILTGYHLIQKDVENGVRHVKVQLFSENILQARIYMSRIDTLNDIAVLETTALPFPPPPEIPWGSSQGLQDVQKIYTVGHPRGGPSWAVTDGTVSRLQGGKVYFSGTAVSSGNSGGPLLDERGTMVGMNMRLGDNLGCALEVDVIRPIIRTWVNGLPEPISFLTEEPSTPFDEPYELVEDEIDKLIKEITEILNAD